MPNQTNSKRISISLNPDHTLSFPILLIFKINLCPGLLLSLWKKCTLFFSQLRDGIKEFKESNNKDEVLKRIGSAVLMSGTEQLGELSKELKEL